MSVIGTRVPRKEDPRRRRGCGRFGDDISAVGQVWARVVRSPIAHGRVRRVDLAPARRADGVTAAIAAGDVPAGLAIPVRLAVQGVDLSGYLQPVLAADVVRYVGEPVAVVVADDPYAAEDAAELVEIDLDEEPAVVDAAEAARPGSPRLFPAGNVAADFTLGYGDTAAAFRQAAHVVEIEVAIGRHSGVPLEPRALLAAPEPRTGALSIFGMTKVPVFNRDVLAAMLGIDENLIHVHAVDAGGGFGVRGEFSPEDYLVPWLARKLGRPVKWAEDRAEHLVAVNHSRQQSHRVAAAFDAQGRITALSDEVVHDNGAYCRTHGIAVPELTVAMLPGPYRVPAYRGRVQVVLTNKTPCGTYRAPGRYEGTVAREQLLDVAADRLGIDRIELRRRNLLGPAELPHRRAMTTLGTDVVLDTGDYPALLAAAAAEVARLGYHDEAGRAGHTGRAGSALPSTWRRAGSGRATPPTSRSPRPAPCGCSPVGRRWGRASRPCSPRSPRTRSGSTPGPWTWSTGIPSCSRSAPGRGHRGPRWWPGTRCTRPRPRSGPVRPSSPPGCSRRPRTTWWSPMAPSASKATRRWRSASATSPGRQPRPALICGPANPLGWPRAAVST